MGNPARGDKGRHPCNGYGRQARWSSTIGGCSRKPIEHLAAKAGGEL